jgi:hypothetical protein
MYDNSSIWMGASTHSARDQGAMVKAFVISGVLDPTLLSLAVCEGFDFSIYKMT